MNNYLDIVKVMLVNFNIKTKRMKRTKTTKGPNLVF